MDAGTVTEIIIAACTVLGVLYGGARWIGKIDRNTEATERLTSAFEKHAERVVEKLEDHEVRITVLESRKR